MTTRTGILIQTTFILVIVSYVLETKAVDGGLDRILKFKLITNHRYIFEHMTLPFVFRGPFHSEVLTDKIVYWCVFVHDALYVYCIFRFVPVCVFVL